MKNSSENKKSQTRSSIMKATINNDALTPTTFGGNSISIRSVPRSSNWFVDGWPEGTCSSNNNRACWTRIDIITKMNGSTRVGIERPNARVFSSRTEDQYPEVFAKMEYNSLIMRASAPLCYSTDCGES